MHFSGNVFTPSSYCQKGNSVWFHDQLTWQNIEIHRLDSSDKLFMHGLWGVVTEKRSKTEVN